jgi:hypothetical protein
MPYEIRWYEDKRIIFEQLYGDLDMSAVIEAANATEQHIKQGNAPVHLVIDVSGMKSFPTNMTKINSVSGYLKDPNLGWVVLVGGNPLTNFVTQVVSQVVRFRVGQRPTLEQAIEFLRKQDATLNGEKTPSPAT